MNEQSQVKISALDAKGFARLPQVRLASFAVFVLLVILFFSGPLWFLISRAFHDDLHSHIVLVPFISLYLLYIRRHQLPRTYSSSFGWVIVCLAGAVAAFAAAKMWHLCPSTLITLSFVCLLASGGFAFLGKRWMNAAAFPFAFTLFMVPLPDSVVGWLENFSKLASADAASLFLSLTGTPVLRDGTVFQLPGIVIEVAQECSGIRSSWILIISSILAANVLLKKTSTRMTLVLAAVPLGVLRNGFRIAVIGLLCVRFGPSIIHSPIHQQGGPVFFALSLIPLFFILWALRQVDRRSTRNLFLDGQTMSRECLRAHNQTKP